MIIISGGQAGVDRAALDVAITLNIPHGGLVPKGRLAEDGRLPRRYKVREMDSSDYAERTRANVDWAEATLIIFRERLTGGTLLTWEYARNRGRPALMVDLNRESQERSVERIRKWLDEQQPEVLNIAGPRESTHPGIYAESRTLLQAVFGGDSRRKKTQKMLSI